MDLRFQPSFFCLASGVLQSSIIPDSDHAEHSEEERTPPGQDVPDMRSDEEAGRGGPAEPEGGGLHTRTFHGGSTVGHPYWVNSRVSSEGSLPQHASHVYQGCNSGV